MPGNVVGNNFPKRFKLENFYTIFFFSFKNVKSQRVRLGG